MMRALLALAIISSVLAAVSFVWPHFAPLSAFLVFLAAVSFGAWFEEKFGGP